MLVRLATFLTLATAIIAQDTNIDNVVAAFTSSRLVNDLAINFKPQAILNLSFRQSNGQVVNVSAGQQVQRTLTAPVPTLSLSNPSLVGPFVIAAVDPDAPTPQSPTWGQVRHYFAGNLQINPSTGALTNSTGAIAAWFQPAPQAGSPAHRYTFLLFKQPPNFASQQVVTPSSSIINFNISRAAQQIPLGDPIAGTFMLVAP